MLLLCLQAELLVGLNNQSAGVSLTFGQLLAGFSTV
jgi:hypothetical protein